MKVQYNIYYIYLQYNIYLEPLYQYINHIDFTTPLLSNAEKCKTAPGNMLANQLDIARQLSFNHRKLWSEQPQVIIIFMMLIN